MIFNLIKIFSLFSTFLAIAALVYLRAVYMNELKTKQMSKTAYVLLVAYLTQALSLLAFAFLSYQNAHPLIASILVLSVLSPYILGRIIKDFDKVNFYIYFQISIFVLDIILVSF